MFSDPTNIVGSRIRAVRTRLGLSQEALAERLHVTRLQPGAGQEPAGH